MHFCFSFHVREGPESENCVHFPSWLGIRGMSLTWIKELTNRKSPIAAATNYHKPGGWKQQEFITFQFSTSDIRHKSNWTKSSYRSRFAFLFRRSGEDRYFCSFGVVGRIQNPVVLGLSSPFPSSFSKPVAVGWIPLILEISLPFSLVSSLWSICFPLPFLRSHVIKLSPPR